MAIAYNYTTQAWERGAEASHTALAQALDELDLLSGPRAMDYARMVGIRDIPRAIATLRASIGHLRTECARV